MTGKIDLHTHSRASDGLLPPGELAGAALEAGVTTLAVCDHDTAAGAAELLKNVPAGLRFIPGVEISARVSSGKCHILGLGCDLGHPAFLRLMDTAAALRRGKLEARIAHIKRLGPGDGAFPSAGHAQRREAPGGGRAGTMRPRP